MGVYTHTSRPSPAQEAGLRSDDVIVRWDGRPTPDSATLSQLVARTQVGAAVDLVAIRGGVERVFQVRVGRRPDTID